MLLSLIFWQANFAKYYKFRRCMETKKASIIWKPVVAAMLFLCGLFQRYFKKGGDIIAKPDDGCIMIVIRLLLAAGLFGFVVVALIIRIGRLFLLR